MQLPLLPADLKWRGGSSVPGNQGVSPSCTVSTITYSVWPSGTFTDPAGVFMQ